MKVYNLMQHFAVYVLLLLNVTVANATSIDTLEKSQRMLAEVLNADGTMKQGTKGSFNAQGFKLGHSKNGMPVFLPVANQDGAIQEGWDNSPSSHFAPDEIKCIAVSGNDLYVGGRNLYKKSGGKWSSLLTQDFQNSNIINAIAISGNDIYIGGRFSSINEVLPAKNIAKFDGTNWSALTGGVNSAVFALAVLGNNLYVGGEFTQADGVTANRIATWDGTAWGTFGTGANGNVNTFLVDGTNLYMGGSFTSIDGVDARALAKWNGTTWNSLGTLNGMVYALALHDNSLYVGGNFNSVTFPNVTDNTKNTIINSIGSIAKLDMNTGAWHKLTSGNLGGILETLRGTPVTSIAISPQGQVYVGGNFYRFNGGAGVSRVARLAGTSWVHVKSGTDNPSNHQTATVSAMAFLGSELVIGGIFSGVGSATPATQNIAQYNLAEDKWGSLSDQFLVGQVFTIAVNGNDIYVGGNFKTSNNIDNLAKWDGSTWSKVSTNNITGTVYTLAFKENDLYVGGSFTISGHSSVKNLATWNGTTWNKLTNGVGPNSTVRTILIANTNIYVGGDFVKMDNIEASIIAKFDGTTWSSLGKGLFRNFPPQVNTLAIIGADLYVGGVFTSAKNSNDESVDVANIARWNTTSNTWSALNGGTNNEVKALCAVGTDLYVGGSFNQVLNADDEKVMARSIAKWNTVSNTWSILGLQTSGTSVNSLAVASNFLYVTGLNTVRNIGGANLSAKGIAKWDLSTSTWSTFDDKGFPGYDFDIHAMNITPKGFFFGGRFAVAGDLPATNFVSYKTSISPLPLNTLGLAAKKQEKGISLQWKTTGEQNVLAHELQRASEDGKFKTLVSLTAKNTSNALYNWIDKNPFQGNNYYRVKTTDTDGKTSYLSEAVGVNFNISNTAINVYPNPVTTNMVNITNVNLEGLQEVTVNDISGKSIVKEKINFTNGNGVLNFNQNLPKGIYLLKVKDRTIKLVVQ